MKPMDLISNNAEINICQYCRQDEQRGNYYCLMAYSMEKTEIFYAQATDSIQEICSVDDWKSCPINIR